MNTPNSIIIPCLSCGAKNRIPTARMSDHPRCGKCGTPLSLDAPNKPVIVSDALFEKHVMQSSLPVLVDCWAPWCGPCRAVGPVMDAVAKKYQGRLKVAKLNLDENPATGARFSIASVPTLLLVKNGKLMNTLVGALPQAQIEAAVNQIL